MASKKDSVIFYQAQIKICKEFLTNEQFGRLMAALFALDDGEDPEVEDDIAMAYAFMSLQQRLDREKYEERCRKNRINGMKGGAPKGNQNARKQPKQPNAEKNNPNDNDNDNENDNDNDNDKIQHSVDSFMVGAFSNVELTEDEYLLIRSTYERSNELIDKVSTWLRDAKNNVPDHYALCVKFATNEKWPRRKVIEPVKPIVIEDPLSDEEQAEAVAKMKAAVGGIFKA